MTVGQTVTLGGKTTVLSKPTTIGGPEGDLAVVEGAAVGAGEYRGVRLLWASVQLSCFGFDMRCL